ncbi:hypothetical protein [Photorhabdus heterorhabditis]|uniref:hypothetical protein n=1 Tax=Photorhabdus heterorhabditis TaxID=880156 RepID=UPI0015628362|nr:hypothetical protein [Photorhabdus heterorhabditis]NRN27255.1 hypothetical protein [Photorhabdus heterorhabditis subsp. aluminescens]
MIDNNIDGFSMLPCCAVNDYYLGFVIRFKDDKMRLYEGWTDGVRKILSPHRDLRLQGELPLLLVIHK